MKQVLVGILSLCLLAAAVAAQEPEMTAEQKAAMEAWMKAGTPGDAHEALEPFVGTFDVKMKMWETPASEPEEMTAVATGRWILGGRWIEQKFESSMMGMPFEGVGYTGYDNNEEQYVATWMDSMSTYMIVSRGKASADGKKFEFEGSMPNPVLGRSVPLRDEIVVVSPGQFESRMYTEGPDGKMFKTMEFIYTRR